MSIRAGTTVIAGVECIAIEAHSDARGCLVALDRRHGLPFDARRIFYLCECPPGSVRGEHAVSADMLLVVIRGSVRLDLDNGRQQVADLRVGPQRGLHIRAGVWIRLHEFQPETVVLVASEETYDDVLYFDEPTAEVFAQQERVFAA